MLESLPEKGVHCVYIVVSTGQIVYVGHTRNIRRRLSQHATKSPDKIFVLPHQGLESEKRMIKACQPLYNQDLSDDLTDAVITAKDLESWNLPCAIMGQKNECVGVIDIINSSEALC